MIICSDAHSVGFLIEHEYLQSTRAVFDRWQQVWWLIVHGRNNGSMGMNWMEKSILSKVNVNNSYNKVF